MITMLEKFFNKATLLLLMGVSFFSCKKEKDKTDYMTFIRTVYPTPFKKDPSVIGIREFLPNAQVKLYRSLEDYNSDTNIVYNTKTDERGEFRIIEKEEFKYYFRIKKDTLNDLRYKKENDDWSTGLFGRPNSFEVPLSTTPTNLQIKVINNGLPIEGAEVKVFYNSNDYKENKAVDNYEFNPAYSLWVPVETFQKKSDDKGIVIFDNLEPRQYWTRIMKSNLSNEGTITMTSERLEDNPDKLNTLDIEIK